MKTPKITVKKVSTFEGHDGIGVNADVYVDGLYVGHAYDDAHGGELDFRVDYENPKAKEVMKDVEEYINTLPERVYNTDKRTFTMRVTVEDLINDAINAFLEEKAQKKQQKEFEKVIAFGVPNASTYKVLRMPPKYTLATFVARPEGKLTLQIRINQIKKQLKEGELFLNADYLRSLGLTV